ncbi:conserved protein of unknown function [Rhodovastum atsumiense]|uniref:DUF2889 domain-containing protein n=1 Tax=Rhodovastum atsumiense TaxID=504468 RepID=A0A5M6ISQ3_9PROT|nr:DUF2889 domain-containing protein [Rhodovastum atsumiense]KAA5611350.1 DUF2889 domain-containing protein [Rhodovastum atsumiense]CAH2603661.1 conserved protein of unknown function [Rhodovastum atsumiense]
MPLSTATERELIHLRDISLRGYHRADGLFDIEAHLRDTKTRGFDGLDRPGGRIEPGEPLHDMWARMTVDEDMVIVAFEAVTAYGPFDVCRQSGRHFDRLAGLTIGPGFLREANARVGGIDGCTHLREMLQQMATTAYQTLWPVRLRRAEEHRRQLAEAGQAPAEEARPVLLNTCYGYADTRDAVRRRWPRLYRGSGSEAAGAADGTT